MIIGGVKVCDGDDCASDLPRNKNAIYRYRGREFCMKICKARYISRITAKTGSEVKNGKT